MTDRYSSITRTFSIPEENLQLEVSRSVTEMEVHNKSAANIIDDNKGKW